MVLLYVFEIYLVLNAAYLIVFSLAGFLPSKQNKNTIEVHNKILTILPTYKEDSVIVDSARAALNQDYPAALHQVVVLSDMLLPTTNSKLVELGATVCIIPNFEVRNKAKSINYFLQNNAVDADYVLILDADNIIETNYIQGLNDALCGGAQILQTKRIAKNDENTLSRLDGLSEIINNHIFRMGQVNLGLSASLIGSGMAFKTSVFKELMAGMEVVSGFDKELEIRIFKQGYNIAYAPHLTVKDEKVGENVVFINQRRRWFFAQIYLWILFQKFFLKRF